jgi:hypothetical protein
MLAVLSNKTTKDPRQINKLPVHDKKYLRSLGLVELNQYPPHNRTKILETFPKFLAVRHPLERLVSAFREKFSDNNKYTRFFINKYGRRIKERTRKTGSKAGTITFLEFASWLIGGGDVDEHWDSYQHLCLPCYINYTYVIDYDSFTEDTSHILRRLFDASLDSFPRRNVKSTKSKHILPQQTKRLSKQLLDKLQDLYKEDFEMFGYKEFEK